MLRSLQVGLAITAVTLLAGAERQDSPAADLGGMQATLKRLAEPTTVDFGTAPLVAWNPKIGGDRLKPSGVLDYFETLHQVKFVWSRADREKLAKKSVTIRVDNRPLFHVLQSVVEQCDCHFAVLPNGDILVELKRPLEQFLK